MDSTFQKIKLIALTASIFSLSPYLAAETLKKCSSAPLMVSSKNVGTMTYHAENCQKSWDSQSVQLDFAYQTDIPEWAFKRAASYFLKKNVPEFSQTSALDRITQLYKPVKKGDFYRLSYQQASKKLNLSLNQSSLGSIVDERANQYFKIWFGETPFNAKLKQQLLN